VSNRLKNKSAVQKLFDAYLEKFSALVDDDGKYKEEDVNVLVEDFMQEAEKILVKKKKQV
jgi:hypothetical protein